MQRHQPLTTTTLFRIGPLVIGLYDNCLMQKQWLQPGRNGLMCTQSPTHSAIQDIRSDWLFAIMAGSVSISFTSPLPSPSTLLPTAAHPLAFLPHCRAIRTVILYELGRQRDLHTKAGRGIHLICL